MQANHTFAVVGGDLRQLQLARLLAADGFRVQAVGLERDVELPPDVTPLKSAAEAVVRSECVILPLPFSIDGTTVNAPFSRTPLPLGEIWGSAREGQLIVGGKFTPEVSAAAQRGHFRAVDYYHREELEVLNAIPTAEGAIQIAMEELPITIHGSRALVIGYGRVGCLLCRDLYALGADVWAAARHYANLAWIRAMRCHPLPVDELTQHIGEFDVIFNTVPAVLLDESRLARVRRDSLVIDLASKPGGVDFETASRLGVKTIWALSLPGKVAPLTAGSIIKDTVIHIITEEGWK